MDTLQVYMNNLKNMLVTATGNVLVIRRFGHPFLVWGTELQSFLVELLSENPCYFTEPELQQLYR
jgi:hypothetical protein